MSFKDWCKKNPAPVMKLEPVNYYHSNKSYVECMKVSESTIATEGKKSEVVFYNGMYYVVMEN